LVEKTLNPRRRLNREGGVNIVSRGNTLFGKKGILMGGRKKSCQQGWMNQEEKAKTQKRGGVNFLLKTSRHAWGSSNQEAGMLLEKTRTFRAENADRETKKGSVCASQRKRERTLEKGKGNLRASSDLEQKTAQGNGRTKKAHLGRGG